MHQPQPVVSAAMLQPVSSLRVDAIDILRAMTMVLMIFVNDLWSLTNIPTWLEHVPNGVDGMGLADAVFPAFLFIVGMSLPFALNNRRQKGDTDIALVGHVISRSIALLIMGVFLVNGESIDEAATGIQRVTWNVLAGGCFILLWNAYPKTTNPRLVMLAKGVAVGGLLSLAVVYRGHETQRFATHWWGLLGLIGWSYLAAALISIFAKNRLAVLLSAWVGFGVLSMVASADVLPKAVRLIPSAISGGTLVGLTMGGVVLSTLFLRYRKPVENKRMTLVFTAAAIGLIGLSMYTRPIWGLSKLDATPAWLFLCSAFTILAFLVVYWLVDVNGKAHWFRFIKPAGTDTLLCYLIPYFGYAGMTLLSIQLPDSLLAGSIGLAKSLLFALLCVWITGRLNRLGIRLRL